MNIQEVIESMVENWYLTEPAYLRLFCTHNHIPNYGMACKVRSGKGIIEYNPDLMQKLTVDEIYNLFKAECARIALKHPYCRKPVNCRNKTLTLASNFVLSSYFDYKLADIDKPQILQLPTKEYYEWYAYKIERISQMPHVVMEDEKKEQDKNKDQDEENQDQDENQQKDGENENCDINMGGNKSKSKNQPNKQSSNGCGKNGQPCPASGSNGGKKKNQEDDDGGQESNSSGSGKKNQGDREGNSPSPSKNQGKEEKESKDQGAGSGKDEKNDKEEKDGAGGSKTEEENGQQNGEGVDDERKFGREKTNALTECSANWQEDTLQQEEINKALEEISANNQWGSMSGDLQQVIKESMIPELNYRQILRSFHTSVISSKRRLTRMRPNRRFGFLQMGSKYDLASKILVAVDCSGSITDYALSTFLGAINRFFKYGVEKLDVITFDTEIHDNIKFTKSKESIKITGRGGTDFQDAINYAINSKTKYDGMIIFTDGYAAIPNVDKLSARLLWCFDCKQTWQAGHEQLTAIKHGTMSCYIK